MISKLVPLFNKVEGTYTMSLNADMALDKRMSPVLKSVNGSGKISSGNFKLSNIPALTALASKVGNGVDLNTIATTEATVISFTIENGNIITKPFDIKLGKTKLTLSGLTGLDQSIDYKVAVALPQITLHAKIGGSFTSPKIALDTAKSAEAVLEKAGIDKEQVVEEVTQKVDAAKQALIAEAEARAAKIVETARVEADKLVQKATNPIAKVAAKAAADKLIAEAERKANEIVEQARK